MALRQSFEALLITNKVIQHDASQTKETYFTIEKYFNGELSNIISEKKVNYYPDFRLPNLKERQLILSYSDSLDQAYFKKCNSDYCKECKEQYPEMWSNIVPCLNDSITIDPTRNVNLGCVPKKENPIYNLRGNVCEWILEPNTVVGGSWKDDREQILKSDTFYLLGTNAWTGFRNVCEWKKWKE
ncbi:MAG: hypothetical protein IPM42_17775 [Saprospiraceae bacterium]|nr:hypothetical protein [Saprospiraceae bacterium]